MALHYHSQIGSNTFHELMIISAAFGGYIVILVGILTGIFTGQPVNKRIVSTLHTYTLEISFHNQSGEMQNLVQKYQWP
jgi:hypothetical protein